VSATAPSTPYIGRPLRRREDGKLLTGKGRYTDDIKIPGTLRLAILRSPHARAIITRVDLSAARAAAGVRLVVSGADLMSKIGNIKPNWVIPGTAVPERPVLAVDRVRFVGECVALAVAETSEAAQDALEYRTGGSDYARKGLVKPQHKQRLRYSWILAMCAWWSDDRPCLLRANDGHLTASWS
jgi:xanthine dehydrogenase molybdopterin-binding subunit B